jgi:PAS domain S-box-containing protein
MTAGQPANDLPRTAESGSGAERLSQLEVEMASLRADNTALREQLALRDHALDSTTSFFVITKQMAPEPIIVYCNKRVAEQHGFRREELIGKSVNVLTQMTRSNGRNTNYRSDVNATFRAGRTYRYEDEVIRSDGTTFWQGVSMTPIFDCTGQLTHAVGIGADITAKRDEMRKKQELEARLVEELKEHKRMALELQLAQKLESVGRLAAGIAHEINTPTQFIGDNVRFLQDSFVQLLDLVDQRAVPVVSGNDGVVRTPVNGAAREGPDVSYLRDEIPKAISQSLEGIERIAKIVGAMKEFSHPGVEMTPVDLNRAIASTITVATNEWRYVADVVTEFDPRLPLVSIMPGPFNQVILNMIVNAAHAIGDVVADGSSAKGTITVTTRQLDGWAEIGITDTGCGMPANIVARIYDPFFTTKPVGKGTGQGLAIAHDVIVQKHGGTITVQSEPRVGTTFTLRVPLKAEGRSAP